MPSLSWPCSQSWASEVNGGKVPFEKAQHLQERNKETWQEGNLMCERGLRGAHLDWVAEEEVQGETEIRILEAAILVC